MSSSSYNQLGLTEPGGTRHIDSEDLVLYALQFLPVDLADDLTSHVAQCESCRNQLALAQGDLPRDTGILRTAAKFNQAQVGAYATVIQPGTVRRGDPVRFDSN